MMGKMAVGLLGLMGKGLLGGGTRRAGTALSILGKGSGCMRSGGQAAPFTAPKGLFHFFVDA